MYGETQEGMECLIQMTHDGTEKLWLHLKHNKWVTGN